MNNKNDKNNQQYKKNHHYNLLQSFSFAFKGIGFALVWERNFRIHLAFTIFLGYFSLKYYNFTKAEFAVLILAMTIVLTCELFNTAIEKAIDLISPEYNRLAKIAKDVAAGAVLVSSIGSLILGIVLFWDIPTVTAILSDIVSHIYIWIPLIIITLLLIFLPERTMKEETYD